MNWKDEYTIVAIAGIVLMLIALCCYYDNGTGKVGEDNCPSCGTRLVIMRENQTANYSDGKTSVSTTYHVERKSN